jgi:uncharacterized membrane protein YkvI
LSFRRTFPNEFLFQLARFCERDVNFSRTPFVVVLVPPSVHTCLRKGSKLSWLSHIASYLNIRSLLCFCTFSPSNKRIMGEWSDDAADRWWSSASGYRALHLVVAKALSSRVR